MTNHTEIHFRPAAVEPAECLKAGYNFVKDQYWLFVGMCLVGMLIGSAVPLGILMGPMMCGIYLTLFSKRRGLPIEFGTLFKGFDYFGPSVVATLIHMVPVIVIIVPAYILFYVAMFATMLTQKGNEPNPAALFGLFGFFALFWIVVVIVLVIVSIVFTFTYPLIVDRGLSGVDAVKLSCRAALANFWRLLGLSMLNFLVSLLGVILCYIGIILVFPITFAAVATAYEQVFGLRDPNEVISNLPPPPPRF